MKLYLVRHGDSIPEGKDDERPLSPTGEAEVKQLAKFLLPLNINVSRIIQSQKHRAQQTANILAQNIVADSIQTSSELAPNASIMPILEEINILNIDTMLVGHMPFMAHLTNFLITKNQNTNVAMFKTSTIVCLEKIEQQWLMRWMLSPSVLGN